MARDFRRGDAAASEFVAALEHVGIGDLLRRRPDLDLGAIFGDQRLELLEQIGAKILGLRHRRRIDAGRGEFGEGARVGRRRALGAIGHAQARITEARALLRRRRRRRRAGTGRARSRNDADGVGVMARRAGRRRARAILALTNVRSRGASVSRRPLSALAAMTTISTVYCGAASLASTVARAGVWPGATHASHTAFISAKVLMSAR